MRNLLVLIFFLSFCALSIEQEDLWGKLDKQYIESVKLQNHKQALSIAFELNRIDPSDTQALLYIVLSSIKSNTKIPDWVLKDNWSNKTSQDILNRLVAEQLVQSVIGS
jgi:hypothetical protein